MAITAALVLLALAMALPAAAQSSDSGLPTLVEVYWNSKRTVVAPGITNVIVLDPEIASAELGSDTIEFSGLQRGETVALGYRNETPVSIRIRVVQRPSTAISPAMLRRQSEMAQGLVSSNLQLSNSSGNSTLSVLNGLSWSQAMANDTHLDIETQVEDNDFQGGHAFNIRHGAVDFRNPNLEVRALDFIVSLTDNGIQRYMSPYSTSDSVELRGGAISLKRGDNQYMLFGGSTIPFYYLTLGATRDIGGFSFLRKQNDKLNLFATTSYINTPTDFLGFSGRRQNDAMQTAGFSYSPTREWRFEGTGGMSNHGGLGRGEVDYTSGNLTLFAAGAKSAPLFPLNQVLSLFSATSSIKAGMTLKNSDRFSESVYYQHATTESVNNVIHAGRSDYLSPSFFVRLNREQDLNFNYIYSHNDGGFTNQSSTGNRFDTNWRYQFTPRMNNGLEFTVGSVQDPLQLNSEDQFSFRDGFTFPVKGGSMLLAFQHDRRNPSLVQKLGSELNLLSPALQNLYLQDPISFVQSGNVPPEVKALLNAQVPINTSISAAGQFQLGSKVRIGPNFSVARADSGTESTWTPFAGYNFNYQATRTLQFNSGLTTIWVLNNSLTPQRTMLFSFGFAKSFSAMPLSLVPGHSSRIIEGRVFRDNNVNGIFNDGEQGLIGLRVELDNGEVATTDEQGRFRFSGVSATEHRISVALTQFAAPVRMTTKNETEVDLIQQKIAIVNFGLIDFARLMGNVFNDLRFEGKRQPDSKGLSDIRLVLDDGKKKRTITTVGAGDFELDDVPPGDYKLTIDESTLPANYVLAKESFHVRVSPVSTVVQDVPLRALRSIAGKVFLKVQVEPSAQPADSGKLKIGGMPSASVHSQRGGQAGGRLGQAGGQVSHGVQQGAGGGSSTGDFNLVPLAGVQISAGSVVAKTDENGKFLLRDLPAGDLTVTVVPVKTVPGEMKIPSGQVRLPAEPIQVQGATIVISNPDLIPYLLEPDQTRNLPIKQNDVPVPVSKVEPPAPAPETANSEPPFNPSAQAETVAAQPVAGTAAGNTQLAPSLLTRKQAAPVKTTSLGMLGLYEQRKVAEFTLDVTTCLLRHDCQSLQDDVSTLAAPVPASKRPEIDKWQRVRRLFVHGAMEPRDAHRHLSKGDAKGSGDTLPLLTMCDVNRKRRFLRSLCLVAEDGTSRA